MKILLAVDDSHFSRAAVDAVINQFRPADTEVHVLHSVDAMKLAPTYVGTGFGPSVPGDFVGVVEVWLDQGQKLVDEIAKTLESAGFRVHMSVSDSDAKTQILSHCRTGVGRFLLSSVSEAVARHANCSVQIVRPKGPPPADNAPAGDHRYRSSAVDRQRLASLVARSKQDLLDHAVVGDINRRDIESLETAQGGGK